nr:MBL fold metallo-hydrolase [Anaeroplasmataceae bacterium]
MIKYIGVNDHQVDLFEGQYQVKNGMSYNSYLIMDEKIAIMDTVDIHFTKEWLLNIHNALDGRLPEYLVVLHMEPDHSASIQSLLEKYPEITVVGNVKTFGMIEQFFPSLTLKNKIIVKEGDILELGNHALKFVFAPMIHWPEVMLAYDVATKSLFSADAFGKFGALDVEEDWKEEARRYYIGIVGKYGLPVQNLFKKVAGIEISTIYPLHGPVLKDNLTYYLDLYNTWS